MYPEYFQYFDGRYPFAREIGYKERLRLLLDHRFNAVHLLAPILAGSHEAQVTIGNDEILLRLWAREQGMVWTSMQDIVLSQIEEHRAEVVYTLNPTIFNSSFIQRLPGCVKKTVCWYASTVKRSEFEEYDLRVSNFPNIIAGWEGRGLKAAYFSPSHDPVMRSYSDFGRRPIDLAFVGTYSEMHQARKSIIQRIALLKDTYNIYLALRHSRYRPIMNLPIIRRIPGPFLYLPSILRKVVSPPVYGRELYKVFGLSKIVFNVAVDLSESYRGNMRCFEAMGCGACLVNDDGIYPEHFIPGVNLVTYRNENEVIKVIQDLLLSPEQLSVVAERGRVMIEEDYSKERQWIVFQKLVADL